MELLPWLAKSTVLLALAFAAAAVLRKGSADVRNLVWRGVFAALLVLPLTVRLAPEWTPAAEAEAPVRTVITVIAGEPAEGPAERRWPVEWVWAAGAGVLLLREAVRWGRSRWVVARSEAFGEETGVRVSGRVAVPAVYGVWKPVIVLPEGAREWGEERLRVVLAHERMHILRGDPWWFAAARVAAALWWPHPLVWFGLSRMVREAEQACDDGVLAAGTPAAEYATHLVAMVRTISANEVRYQGGLPMIRVSELERRLRAMLNPKLNRRPAARGALLGVVAAMAMVMAPLSSLRAPAQEGGEASVRGVVEDAEGRPVARARVDVRKAAPMGGVREVVMTDETGAFRVDGLVGGTYTVTVSRDGMSTVQIASMKVEGGAMPRLRVQMMPAGDDGRPLARVETSAAAPPKLEPATKAEPAPMPKRITVGGGVQAARMTKQVAPVYPAECKAEGVEGTVVLRAVIGKDGTVQSVQRVNRLVDARLADAAMEAVKQWVYQPTLLNGEPVEVVTDVDVNFTLAEKNKAAAAANAGTGGVFRIGAEVSPPVPIYKVEPEYSEEARKIGYQGTVVLSTVIDAEGTPTQIKVVRSLGMGLDEKAMEALGKWKFRPARKDGKAVSVVSNIEMNFRLLEKKP